MISFRCWLALLVLFGIGCGSAEHGSDSNGTSGATTGGAATGGAAVVGGTSAGGSASTGGDTSSSGGNAQLGGTPTIKDGGCEPVEDAESFPTVTLPHDECLGQPDVVLPPSGGGCVIWTGLGYLHVTSDSRGIIVSLLNQDGVLLHEDILDTQSVDSLKTRFSRNGDRVLLVVDLGIEETWAIAVLDLQGTPLSPLYRLAGEDYPQRFDFAITSSADGWLVAFGYNNPSGSRGILFSKVSRDALLGRQYLLGIQGYVNLDGFTAAENGEVLLDGQYDSGGVFSTSYKLIVRVDLELDDVSCLDLQLE